MSTVISILISLVLISITVLVGSAAMAFTASVYYDIKEKKKRIEYYKRLEDEE